MAVTGIERTNNQQLLTWIDEMATLAKPDDIYWCDGCRDSVNAITYFEFKEKIAEECGGNKDKYDEIMDGSRM